MRSARDDAPSFFIADASWFSTVRRDTLRARAMSAFELPSTASATTVRSAGDRESGSSVPPRDSPGATTLWMMAVLDDRPSLRAACDRCVDTVDDPMPSSNAITLLDHPRLASSRTCSSRCVRAGVTCLCLSVAIASFIRLRCRVIRASCPTDGARDQSARRASRLATAICTKRVYTSRVNAAALFVRGPSARMHNRVASRTPADLVLP